MILLSFPKSGTNLVEEFLQANSIISCGRSISPESYIKARMMYRRVFDFTFDGNIVDIGFELNAPYSMSRLKRNLNRVSINNYISGHIGNYNLVSQIIKEQKVLYVTRNNRDVLWSYLNYVKNNPNHFFYKTYNKLGNLNFLRLLLNGGNCDKGFIINPWKDVIKKDLKLRKLVGNSSNGFVLEYENMISDKIDYDLLMGFLNIELKIKFNDVLGLGKTYSGKIGNDKWKDTDWFVRELSFYE